MPLREVVKQAILTGVPYLSRVCGHRCRKRGGIHAASGSFEEGRLNKNRDAHLCATPVFTEYILWNIGKVSKVVAYFAENAAQYMPSRGSLDMGGRIKNAILSLGCDAFPGLWAPSLKMRRNTCLLVK